MQAFKKEKARQLPTLAHSTTIGVKVLNYCVRYGNRCDHFAIITRLALSKLDKIAVVKLLKG